jgi:hypothetical protein
MLAACRNCGWTSGALEMEESTDVLRRLHQYENHIHRVMIREVPNEAAFSQEPCGESAT